MKLEFSAWWVAALVVGCGANETGAAKVSANESLTASPVAEPATSAPPEVAPPATPMVAPTTGEGTPAPVGIAGNPVEGGGSPSAAPPAAATAPEQPAMPAMPAAPAEVPDSAPVGPDPNLATRALCTGTNPIACHFGGAPGNYAVTVVLGGDAPAQTLVQAETRRAMLPPVATAAGQARRFTFNVNVRQPEGEPIQAVPPGTPGLDVYFVGDGGVAPALQSIGFGPAVAPVRVFVAGDSTVCDQNGLQYGGWGQQLPQFFNFPVVVANYADSGESSGSFLNARALFPTIEAQLQAKDWVLIQFGHNDKTVTAAQFHDNMTQLVTRVKDKGAFPVLFTPVARAQFNGDAVSRQHVNSTGADLPQIVAQVAMEQNVPMFDLTSKTAEWLGEVGPTGWQAFHALGTDVTHTNAAGALVEAVFIRDFIRTNNVVAPLADLLR